MSIQSTVKLLGALTVVLSSVWWGVGKVRHERRKTDELDAFCDLVAFIGENISHFVRPLPEIYAEYTDGFPRGSAFAEVLRAEGMNAAIDTLAVNEDDACARDMYSFAERIGGGFREEQTELCEYTRSRLLAVCEKRKTTAKEREKLYLTIPLLLSFAAILMFI